MCLLGLSQQCADLPGPVGGMCASHCKRCWYVRHLEIDKIHFFIFSLLQFSVKNKEDILLDRIKMNKNWLEFDQKKLTTKNLNIGT